MPVEEFRCLIPITEILNFDINEVRLKNNFLKGAPK